MTVPGLITGRSNEFLHQNGQTYSGVSHPTSYSIDNKVLFLGRGREVKRLRIEMPRLRMSGGIPLLPTYAFMVWTGKTLLFTAVLTTLPVTQFV